MEHNFSEVFEKKLISDWSYNSWVSEAEKQLLLKYIKNTNGKTVEAGTGGGRFAFYSEELLNLEDIVAFDIIPELIAVCRRKAIERNSKVNFILANATNLNCFKDNEFDNLLYLGQVLSMLPEKLIDDALLEAYRIGSSDGVYIFSFMDWNSRWFNYFLSLPLNMLRFLRGDKVQKYYLPEIKSQTGINLKFFNKGQNCMLWTNMENAFKMLNKANFKIEGSYYEKDLTKSKKGTVIYIICKKSKN